MSVVQPQKSPASTTYRATLVVTTLLFFSLFALAYFLTVEVVSSGQGRFLSLNRVKAVTSQMPGRVAMIHASDGMSVVKGQILVDLEATEQSAQLRILKLEQTSLKYELARIKEILSNFPLDTGDVASRTKEFSLQNELGDLARSASSDLQLALLKTQIDSLTESLAQNLAQSEVLLSAEAITRAELSSLQDAILLQKERLIVSEALFRRGAISRSNYLDVQLGLIEFEGRRAVAEQQIRKDKAAIREIQIERKLLVSNAKKQLTERRIQIEARLESLAQEDRVSRHRLGLSKLRAPADGVVDQLLPISVGSVIGMGTDLMRIVPESDGLELEARFSTSDSGLMFVGQKANIHVDAFPSDRFGVLKGTISYKSLDSVKSDDGSWVYIVRAKPDKDYVEANGRYFKISPGMTARVDAVTDQRRIISYFFSPVLSALRNSLREP